MLIDSDYSRVIHELRKTGKALAGFIRWVQQKERAAKQRSNRATEQPSNGATQQPSNPNVTLRATRAYPRPSPPRTSVHQAASAATNATPVAGTRRSSFAPVCRECRATADRSTPRRRQSGDRGV